MACTILIFLWVQDELSYDRFHKNADHIYMVLRNNIRKASTTASTSKMLAPALKDELPEVFNATSFVSHAESYKSFLHYKEKGFNEDFILVDPHFFNIFSFDFKEGNPQTALLDPNSIILTENIVKKYFGDKNALGESLNLTLLGKTRPLKVTGILENIPHNSHIQREMFIPISFMIKTYNLEIWNRWENSNVRTFILTQSEINISDVEKKITDCERKHLPDQKLENISHSLLPLKKIHLHANNIEFYSTTGDIKYVYIFTVIAGIILLIASLNYMNLANALSLKRTKEIGIQKVVGARRSDLIRKYFGETLIMTFIALGFALMLVRMLLPSLSLLSRKSLFIPWVNPQFLVLIFLITLATGIISGLYPAIFISGFQPIKILKGKFLTTTSGLNLRKGLIIFQFSLSIIIIICTIVVFSQLNFIKNSKLGYDKENIVCLRVKGDIHSRYNAFKNKVLENSDILDISRSQTLDINSMTSTGGIHWPGRDWDKEFSISVFNCDCDFASTYKIEMHDGRFYSDQFPTDKTNAYVLNQAAIEAMDIQSPIGKEIYLWDKKGNIVGVTKDFHFSSFHRKIEPLIFRIPPDINLQNRYYRELSIRFRPNSIHQSMAFLKDQWKSFFPDEQFDYSFVDENLNNSYRAEQRMSEIFKYFSFLAIFIACLGLYGLTALTIEQKFKDIGVRKVLGASISKIVLHLLKNYFWWILYANIIAWPIAWYAMNRWLQSFAYRTDIDLWIYLLSGSLALIIALLTVSYQVVKAARANPINSLKYE